MRFLKSIPVCPLPTLGTHSYAEGMPRVWEWFCAILLAVVVGYSCVGAKTEESAPRIESLRGLTMGSHWSVKYVSSGAAPDRLIIQRALQSILDRLEAQMSTWRDDSDLSRFNLSRSTEWFAVPNETARVVAEAQRISRITEGTFDVTVLPFLKLWGFGARAQQRRVPSVAEIAAARASVGWEKLEVRLEPSAVRKKVGGLQVDLSGIAPGFAADELGAWLERRGVTNYLVDVGGELRAQGVDHRGGSWRVGIERPVNTERVMDVVVSLKNMALATSGDYRNYFEHEGKRYGHILDLRTGSPSESGVVSVSVAHSSAMTADALATALVVLGAERGMELARREGLAVRYVERKDGKRIEQMTPSFRLLLDTGALAVPR